MSLTLTRRHNVDRFGYLIPHRYGNLPMVEAVATYRPGEGRFGGAVAVEEGTENLISNPKFENGLNGWKVGSYLDVAVEDSDCPIASKHAAVTLINLPSNNWFHVFPIDIILSGTYTVSLWAKIPEGLPVRINLYDETHNTGSYKTVTGNGTWQKYTHVRTFSEDTTKAGVYLYHTGDVDTTFYVTAVQLEAKPFATSFVDGTRPDGILAYPIALKDDYTIACYRKSHTDEDYKHVVKRSDGKVFVDGVEDSGYDVGWIAGRNLLRNSDFSSGTDFWSGQFSIDGNEAVLQSTVGSSHLMQNTIEIPEGEYVAQIRYKVIEGQAPYLHAVSGTDMTILEGGIYFDVADNDWNTHTVKVRVNSKSRFFAIRYASGDPVGHLEGKTVISWVKIEKGSKATDWTPAPEDLGYSDDCLMFSNQTGLIDELLILPYAASEEEIASWYEAQGLLPPHPQASLQWDWQTVRPAQMVKL